MDLPWTEPTVAASVVALIEALCKDEGLCDPKRVHLTGIGAGGSGCWGLGAATILQALCVHSTGARSAPERRAAARAGGAPGHEHLGLPRLERRDDARRLHRSVGECARRTRAEIKYTRPDHGPADDPVAALLPGEAAPMKGESTHVRVLPAASPRCGHAAFI